MIIDYVNHKELPKSITNKLQDIYTLQLQYYDNSQDMETQAKILEVLEKRYPQHPLDFLKVGDLTGCKCPERPLFEKILDPLTPQATEAMAYASCKHTIYAAAKRQMKAAPTPNPEVSQDFIQHTIHLIEDELGEKLNNFGYSYEQWYNHLSTPKQKIMDKVALYYQDRSQLSATEVKKIEQDDYEGICKVEIQGIDGKPRMVCSIPIRHKFVMGPVAWALEEVFADSFNGYCGGQNLDEMAKKINKYADKGFTKVVQGDGSAFDNTQDVTLKEVDRYIYRRVLHSITHVSKTEFLNISQEMYKTMSVKYAQNKKCKTLFRYKILGSVFSGDCDTTLANTIRMASYNRYVNDKAGLKYGVDYITFSKGDDFTVMYKPYITDEFITKAYYRYFLPSNPDPSKPDTRIYGLGQVLKMLDIGGLDSIKFCSLRAWYKDDQHIILTRDPKKFYTLAKYSRKTKAQRIDYQVVYLLDQATALRQSYAGLSIFDTMADIYIERAQYLMAKYKITQREIDRIKRKAERAGSIDIIKAQLHKYYTDRAMEASLQTVKHRHTTYKIHEDYWTTMQKMEKIRTENLTPVEIERINEQIEAEFKSEELKTLMGSKKYYYGKKQQ